ncbi:MAG: rhodanese-like domain-containing protein [Clostridium sp.]
MNRIELRKSILNENYMFIDLRDSNSFNGWKLNGEKIEGHIKGAINLCANWIDRESFILDSKKNIVLCYSRIEDLNKGFEIFKEMKNLDYFDMKELEIDDKDLVEYYKNYKILVPPEYIINNKDIKIFHVGFGKEEDTSIKGHILGSIYIDTDEVEPPPLWRIGNSKELKKVVDKYGLAKSDNVVVTAWDQMAAFRVALVLEYIGIENVMILNGGLEYYEKMGYPLSNRKENIIKKNSFEVEIPKNKEIIVTTEEVRENIEKQEFELVDNRTLDEYLGKISGYSYHDKAARIPKARFGYAGFEGANSLDYYRNIDGTMKTKEDIEFLWKDIDKEKRLVFMCGSGWRASEVYFYAKTLGYEDIGVYSDGWIGWSNEKNNPIEIGGFTNY